MQGNLDISNHIVERVKSSNDTPLLLIFNSEWSSHSEMIKVIAEKIERAAKNIFVVLLDEEQHKSLFKQYGISHVPTAIIIKKQRLIAKVEHMFSKKNILDKLEEVA